jgi:hypothetical protein
MSQPVADDGQNSVHGLRTADKNNRDREKPTPRFGSGGSNLECDQC